MSLSISSLGIIQALGLPAGAGKSRLGLEALVIRIDAACPSATGVLWR
jgi:hypothetical protein